MGRIRIGTKMALLAFSATLLLAAPRLVTHVTQGMPHGARGAGTGKFVMKGSTVQR